jgi:hypothetical protein
MSIPIVPEKPINNFEFKTVTRDSSRPSYLIKPSAEPDFGRFLPELPESDATIDVMPARLYESRSNLLESGPIPEIVPALLGLRLAWANHRIRKAEDKIDSLSHDGQVLLRAAELIVRDKGFRALTVKNAAGETVTNDLRPYTPRQSFDVMRLNKLFRRRHQRGRAASNIAASYTELPGGSVESTGTATPDFKAHSNRKRLLKERWPSQKDENLYVRLGGQIDRRDARFKAIVSRPYVSAEIVSKKRHDLVLKSEALRRAKAEGRNLGVVEAIKGDGQRTKRAMLRALERGAELANKGADRVGDRANEVLDWTGEKAAIIGGFATALRVEEIPRFVKEIEAADQAYEDSAEKGFKPRSGHEAKMYAKNAKEAAKATQRAWRKRKSQPPLNS